MNARNFLLITACILTLHAAGVTKTTQRNGVWNDPTVWSPSGVPVWSDDVVIRTSDSIIITDDQSINSVLVQPSAKLYWSPLKRLTITSTFTVEGYAHLNGGLITIPTAGQRFTISNSGVFVWDPGINTSAEASLFIKGSESFSPTGTLVIKRWFNYSNSLGQYITGDFGNLTINTPGPNNTIVEWNQGNQFQNHKILGKLTIEDGWITLDKSGSITVTPIGSIELTGINSTFYGHNGTHPSSFSIVTSSITNNGGTFFGLNDGNGNTTIHCIGDFINYGNVKIINNSGVLNVSNGNAVFNVDGTFTQHTGDTRIIYNITTNNSGTYAARFSTIRLNGGIFMGQTGCHRNGGTSYFTVNNDFIVNFRNSGDKFRAASLTSMGSFVNNCKINIKINGNLLLNGVNTSEFSSSASAGEENVSVGGNINQSGTTCNFNYGTSIASHPLNLTIGSLSVSAGVNYLSRNNDIASITVNGNINLNGGITIVKGGSGAVNIECRKLLQQGGNLYLHSNTGAPTLFPIQFTINEVLNHSGGTLSFDDNTSLSSAINYINIKGDSVILSGSGLMTRAGAGSFPINGELQYLKNGVIQFNRSGSHLIEQVIQTIKSGTEVNVLGSSFQISSHAVNSIRELVIESGGILSLNNGQIRSNTLSANSNFLIDSMATLRIGRGNGLFDGTLNASINPSGNLQFSLHKNSIVEYNGFVNQTVTGINDTSSSNQKYGVLRIQLRGNGNNAILNPKVFVRTGLELNRGELVLNRNTITIENGIGSAVSRQSGYMKSEDFSTTGQSFVRWLNIQSGLHIVPFGVSSMEYIPVHFNPLSGYGNEVLLSTWRTSSDNLPKPVSPSYPSSLYFGRNTIDRWWFIQGRGMKGDVLLSYTSSENSTSISGSLKVIPPNNNAWGSPCIGTATLTGGTGNVTASGTYLNGSFMICETSISSALQNILLNANIVDGTVRLKWNYKDKKANTIIEKSLDGVEFKAIGRPENGTLQGNEYAFNFTDYQLTEGRSYYRLRIGTSESELIYSEIKVIQNSGGNIKGIETTLRSVYPNPFSDHLNISYSAPGTLSFRLFDQWGKVVREQTEYPGKTGSATIEELSELPSGIYFLAMQTETEKQTRKLIKQ